MRPTENLLRPLPRSVYGRRGHRSVGVCRQRILVFLCATGLCLGAASAQDWPSFRGDPQLRGVATTALPTILALQWVFQAPAAIESTAAVVDRTIYVGAMDGRLYALDLETGQTRWEYAAAGEIKSSPTVAGGRVYFGDESGVLHAVDAATGVLLWQTQVAGAISSSPNFFGSRLYFGSYDNNLYCVAAADGAVAWKSETAGYIHGTPAVWGATVAFAGCDGRLRVLDAYAGTLVRALDLEDYVGASMAVAGDRGFVGTFGNQVLGIDLAAGAVAWRFRDPDRTFPFYASPALAESLLIVAGRDKTVRALGVDDGVPKWTYAAGARVDSSPVISGARVFFGTDGGDLVGLAIASGERLWQFAAGAAIAASPAVASGRLLIGATDGRLYCFGPGGEE